MGYWSISTSNYDGWKHTKHTEVSDNAKKQTKTHWSPLENARIEADSPFCNPSCIDKLSAQRQQHWRPDGQPSITHSPMKGHNTYKVILHHPENQTQIWSSLDPTAKLWVREDRGTRSTTYLMGMRPAKSSRNSGKLYRTNDAVSSIIMCWGGAGEERLETKIIC